MRRQVAIGVGLVLACVLLCRAEVRGAPSGEHEPGQVQEHGHETAKGPVGFDVLQSLLEPGKSIPDQLNQLQSAGKLKSTGAGGWAISTFTDAATVGNFTWTLAAKQEEAIAPGSKVHLFFPILKPAKIRVTVDGHQVWSHRARRDVQGLISPAIPIAVGQSRLRITVWSGPGNAGGVSNIAVVRPSRELQLYRYSGLILVGGWALLAIALTSGWRQLMAGAALGLVAAWIGFVMLPGDPTRTSVRDWLPLVLASLLGAAVVSFLVAEMRKAHAAGRENFPWFVLTFPYSLLVHARDQIVPADSSPQPGTLLANQRWDCLTLAYGAIAGAAAGAVLAQWDVLLEVLQHLFGSAQGFGEFAFLIFLNSGFLIPLHHALAPGHEPHPPRPDKHESSGQAAHRLTWYWYAVIPLSIVPLEFLGVLFHHGTSGHSFSAAVLTSALNAQIAGIATYFIAAACQAQPPSIPKRAAVTASYLGAVVLFPVIYMPMILLFPYDWLPSPGVGSSSGMVLALIVCITICFQAFLAAVGALFLAVLSFGLYAGAGAWATTYKSSAPLWLRIALALIVVELVRCAVIVGVLHYVFGITDMAWEIMSSGAMFVAGWTVGMAIGLKKKDILLPGASAVQTCVSRDTASAHV